MPQSPHGTHIIAAVILLLSEPITKFYFQNCLSRSNRNGSNYRHGSGFPRGANRDEHFEKVIYFKYSSDLYKGVRCGTRREWREMKAATANRACRL